MSNILVGRLFREISESCKLLSEEVEEGKEKKLYLKGMFAQGNIKNNNGRVYPEEILDAANEEFIENMVKKDMGCCELLHPDSPKINLDRVCAKIVELTKDEANWIGKARVIPTPMGEIVKGLIKGGIRLGASSRGLGSADKSTYKNEECNLVNNFVIRAYDIVHSPSGPDCYVDAITEAKEWILDNTTGAVAEMNEENYKMFESRIKVLPVKDTTKQEVIFESIKNFLNSLRANR